MTREIWPLQLELRMMPWARTRRAQSPSRDVSPVSSYYSEPVSLPRHKDVLRGLPGVGEEDREDAEEVLSLRSLPCVRNTLNKDHKVKRPRGLPSRPIVTGVSDVRLPAINHQQQESRPTLIVRGLQCGRKTNKCPPIINSRWGQGYSQGSTLPERPPGRAGRRPDRHIVSSSSCEPRPVPQRPFPREGDHTLKRSSQTGDTPELPFRHSSHNPPGPSISTPRQCLITASHASHGATNTGKATTHGVTNTGKATSHGATNTAVLPRPGWRRGAAFKRGALECVWEEGCGLPSVPYPHLLEPLSGFREQLCRQLLHSPLPYREEATLGPRAKVPPCTHLQPRDSVPAAPQRTVTVLLQGAVDVPGWQGRTLPKITMTRPTPSPKHALRSESRQSA